jgi:putative DNA primase/helicase
MTEVISAFLAAMARFGIVPAEPVNFVSGQFRRFRAKGDKHGRENGWAIIHLDVMPCGAFGHWRLGVHEKWRFEPGHAALSSQDYKAFLEQVQVNEALRAEEALRLQVETAGRATFMWQSAANAQPEHPYLMRKALLPLGVRQIEDHLLVPMTDDAMQIWNVQRIWPDGTKRFLKGGRTAGLFWRFGWQIGSDTDDDPLVIGEGYATMTAIHQATGLGVAAALSATNLEQVARCMRAMFPTRRLIIAADNDAHLATNVGVEAARKAASAADAALVIPEIG